MSELGRPTIYSGEIVLKAKEYLSLCKDTERDDSEYLEPQYHGGSLQRNKKMKVKLPTKGGLAKYLGISRDTLYEWAKEYKVFSDIMEELGAEQEDRLINNGLSGDYNPTIAKVLLTKHGYREGTELTGKDGDDLLSAKDLVLSFYAKRSGTNEEDTGTV